MTTIWAFLVVLSGLILVHEFGHFIVARAFGVRVLKFSIGFGPRVWGIIKNGTDYCISLVPLGGFVKMLGEESASDVLPEEEEESFAHKPLWQRALIVAAGPFSNFLFAFLVFFVIVIIYGSPILLPVIGDIAPHSPAMKAGIKKGDRIISINGIKIDSWEELSSIIKSSGENPLTLIIERDNPQTPEKEMANEDYNKGGKTAQKSVSHPHKRQLITVTVTPKISATKNIFGEQIKVPLIGITAAGDLRIERVNPFKALYIALQKTWEMIDMTFKGIIKIFERVVPISSLGGPILIAQMAGKQAELGIINLFFFMALLSINLGFLNLLPIPVLDGGHLFFYLIEAIIRRPLSEKQMEYAQKVGFVILGAIMLIVFYNDIMRIIGILPDPMSSSP